MKILVSALSKKFKRFIRSDKSTLHKLNYLTLKIDSVEITKDLYNHSINQKISLFWIFNILAFLNFLSALIGYSQSENKDVS